MGLRVLDLAPTSALRNPRAQRSLQAAAGDKAIAAAAAGREASPGSAAVDAPCTASIRRDRRRRLAFLSRCSLVADFLALVGAISPDSQKAASVIESHDRQVRSNSALNVAPSAPGASVPSLRLRSASGLTAAAFTLPEIPGLDIDDTAIDSVRASLMKLGRVCTTMAVVADPVAAARF